jgi:hypothetical protein
MHNNVHQQHYQNVSWLKITHIEMDPEKQKKHYVNYLQCITLWPLSQWVSGVVSNFSAISRRKQVTFRRDDFDVVLVQQA